ncbi:MAG: hypothetical protein IJ640_03870 [Prevotella sp.]|nr:hypothetical protein [Prevotella sp.]
MDTTRMGAAVSAQVSRMGEIVGLDKGNFSVEGVPFNVKNDGDQPVELEVNLWDMQPGTYITTRFAEGWNPEIVREIKQTSQTALSLKWGC